MRAEQVQGQQREGKDGGGEKSPGGYENPDCHQDLSLSNIKQPDAAVPSSLAIVNPVALGSVGRPEAPTGNSWVSHLYHPSSLTLCSTLIIDTYKGTGLLTQIGV